MGFHENPLAATQHCMEWHLKGVPRDPSGWPWGSTRPLWMAMGFHETRHRVPRDPSRCMAMGFHENPLNLLTATQHCMEWHLKGVPRDPSGWPWGSTRPLWMAMGFHKTPLDGHGVPQDPSRWPWGSTRTLWVAMGFQGTPPAATQHCMEWNLKGDCCRRIQKGAPMLCYVVHYVLPAPWHVSPCCA